MYITIPTSQSNLNPSHHANGITNRGQSNSSKTPNSKIERRFALFPSIRAPRWINRPATGRSRRASSTRRFSSDGYARCGHTGVASQQGVRIYVYLRACASCVYLASFPDKVWLTVADALASAPYSFHWFPVERTHPTVLRYWLARSRATWLLRAARAIRVCVLASALVSRVDACAL